ncbi:tautomerase family protein [Arcobacter sp.]|uniref:tautomerase family protein n=1 Tax=Arcobacter sp. TaxID=1872629 RepID=UPI003C741D5F
MPYINIKLNVEESVKVREKIVEIVLDKTTHILNKKREVTSVLVEFVPFSSWSVGGINSATFSLDIKVTKGTNTKDQKAEYIESIYKEFKNLLGEISIASYITIDEVNGDSWGFEGLTQEYRYIKGKA